MQKIKNLLQKELPFRLFCILVAGCILSKLVLGYLQMTYIWVGGAPIDDELMFHAAQSISAGQWLGEYTWLTLSKQMFFAVWLAFCNLLNLPYLVAGQALWCAASLAAMQAFAPVLHGYKWRFMLFVALCFNPAAAASFTLRVYRDNIFPALCLLFFAGMIGAALRYRGGVGCYARWLLLAGMGMGCAYITREDGVWLLPFALVASVITAVFIWREAGLCGKLMRCVCQLLPYALTAVAVLTISGLNYQYYGIFATSDFSQGAFTEAYGAMTRVVGAEDADAPNFDGNADATEDISLVPVSYSARSAMYALVPDFALLEPMLETDEAGVRGGYYNADLGDYQAGAFYWILRKAASEAGFYADAKTAEAYWQGIADEINAAMDIGALTARTGKRSSTTPIIRGGHVLPTLAETFAGLWHCLTFADTAVYFESDRSIASVEDAALWTQYLGSNANYAAVAGGEAPYYSIVQLLVYGRFNALCWLYRIAIPLLFVAALFLQVRRMVAFCRTKNWADLLPWLILLGVLGMALLRCAMIAFMEVAAFQIGTYIMYLATVHPLLIIFAVVGVMPVKSEK